MDLKKEILTIKERNRKVELDKKWERSWVRRGIIAIGTYFTAAFLFTIIQAQHPFLAALVPSLAYVLSTLTLPMIKTVVEN